MITIRRRDFIAGAAGAAAWPLAARAQQGKPVIGFLRVGSAAGEGLPLTAFYQALNEGGYVEGQNVEILFRSADYQVDLLRSLASDLVDHRAAVIVAIGTSTAVRARMATSTTPIVCASGSNPVLAGLIDRYNRPGGNVTGVNRVNEAFFAKGVELLHELLPEARSITRLALPTSYYSQPEQDAFFDTEKEAENVLRTLGLRLNLLEASNLFEIEQAFASVGSRDRGGVLLDPNTIFLYLLDQIVALAERYRVPTVYSNREAVQAGGLISYGGSSSEMFRIVGNYVARILKGAKPADLPWQQVTRVELAINLKTAKALDIQVPLRLLVRADEVIE